jgi:hypothetical protein
MYSDANALKIYMLHLSHTCVLKKLLVEQQNTLECQSCHTSTLLKCQMQGGIVIIHVCVLPIDLTIDLYLGSDASLGRITKDTPE